MPMIILSLDKKSKGIGDPIVQTFRYSFDLKSISRIKLQILESE